MVDRDFITTRQPRPNDAGRAHRRRHPPPRPRKWRAAIVGLLLASGAGVYTYRQFIQPVPDAEDTAAPARDAIPGPGFDQIASLQNIPEPVETPVAVVPAIRPEPQERRELDRPPSLPPSSDAALQVARSRTVAVSSGAPPSPAPRQPAADRDEPLPGSALPSVDPSLLTVTPADSGKRADELSTELTTDIAEAADTPPLLPPVPGAEDTAQASYARAETVLDAGVQPGGVTAQVVEPSFVAPIAEAEPPPSEVLAAESIQIAPGAQLAVGDRPAGLSDSAAGELPDSMEEIEPSAALAAVDSKEAFGESPEPTPLLAKRPTGETMIAARSAEVEPALVPARPAPEAPASAAAIEPRENDAAFVPAGPPEAPPSAAAIEPREDDAALVPVSPVPAPPASAAATVGASASSEYVQRFPMVVLNGTPLGAITVREFAGNQRQIHLGALLSLFRSRMDPVEYERLISAGSADQFVSLEVLRRAGLDAQYDARRERLIIGSQNDSPDE